MESKLHLRNLWLIGIVICLLVSSCSAAPTAQPPDRPQQTATQSAQRPEWSERVATLLSDFQASDWTTIYRAGWQLESLQGESIPALISLLDTEEITPLTGTADLIYPGAKEFSDFGPFVDYDLDYIPARAGWALEELTFQDFGFSESRIREQEQSESAIRLPPDLSARRARIQNAIVRAKDWWKEHGATWTRYAALQDALKSGDPIRQARALGWIRYGTSRCDGLTPESYSRDLLPIVKILATSEDESVRTQADLLLNHDGDWWWKYKTDPSLREWEDPQPTEVQ